MQVEVQAALTMSEAARRLAKDVGDVFDLVVLGELAGGPDRTGRIMVSDEDVRRYRDEQAETARS